MVKQLVELLCIASIAMPNPRLPSIQFLTDAKHIINGTDAMKKQRFLELFTKLNFLTKHF